MACTVTVPAISSLCPRSVENCYTPYQSYIICWPRYAYWRAAPPICVP